ncbi:MAG: glycoside hydrolase family 31 protein [Bacteroidales bacterium]
MKRGKRTLKIEWSRSAAVETMELYWRTPAMKDDSISLWSQAGKGIDYYFVFGPALDGVVAGYRELTGRSPMLPKWAYGFWQSRERYQTQEELVSTVREFRKRKVPMDVIVQDWQYWQSGSWGSHEFDPARFPDPKAAFDNIHALNARVMISVWPKFLFHRRTSGNSTTRDFIYPQQPPGQYTRLARLCFCIL